MQDRQRLAVDAHETPQLVPQDHGDRQDPEDHGRDRIDTADTGGLRFRQLVDVPAGAGVRTAALRIANTRGTQKHTCTTAVIPAALASPITAPPGSWGISGARATPAKPTAGTMVSSSFSSRHQVRKYRGPIRCSGRSTYSAARTAGSPSSVSTARSAVSGS